MLKKIIILISTLTFLGCASTAKVISEKNKNDLIGAKINYVIEPTAGMRSNLGAAMLLGSLGHNLKGSQLQQKLAIKDPSIYVLSGLEKYLTDTYRVKKGSDYQIVVKNYFWELNDPIMDEQDNLHISIGSRMQLFDKNNKVIASDECYEHMPMTGDFHLTEKDLDKNNEVKFSKAFSKLANKCVKRFKLKL